MRKITDLALTGAGTNDVLERGELTIEKGRKLMGLRLKCTVPLANSSGGAVTLTAAQKRTLLEQLVIETFDFGKGGKFAQPFVDIDFRTMRRHFRRCYRSEIEGWSDSTTGLARSLPNLATTSVTFDLVIPTGKWAAAKGKALNRWGMGRSQCESTYMKIRRQSGTNQVLTGVVISGTVSIDLYDDSVPCKGDVFNPVPALHRHDDTKIEVVLPEGLPLALDETSAIHTASTLTNVSFRIDDLEVHKQISLQETIKELLDSDDLPADALLTDEVTVIYETAHNQIPFDMLPTGTPRFKQEGTRTNSSVSFLYTYLPIDEPDKIAGEVRNVAVEQRKKDVNAVSGAIVRGESLPARLMPYAGMVLTDRDDREFESIPGLFADVKNPTAPAQPMVPQSMVASTKARFAAHKSAGEDKAAQKVVDELAATIPGAVPTGRGFARGNGTIRAVFEQKYFR